MSNNNPKFKDPRWGKSWAREWDDAALSANMDVVKFRSKDLWKYSPRQVAAARTQAILNISAKQLLEPLTPFLDWLERKLSRA